MKKKITVMAFGIALCAAMTVMSGCGAESDTEPEAVEEAETVQEEEENTDITPTVTEVCSPTPEATSTPKPVPTETPTPVPTATPAEEMVEVGNAGNGEDYSQGNTVIYIGDLRFRTMQNIGMNSSDVWECDTAADYNWLTGTAFPAVDEKVKSGTKVFINVGLNDMNNKASYAAAINAKASEWKERGASVYFVAVGPVSETSYISNQDIMDFNTYMYQNLNTSFIDLYNYLVQNGYESYDGQTYSESTSIKMYTYLAEAVS